MSNGLPNCYRCGKQPCECNARLLAGCRIDRNYGRLTVVGCPFPCRSRNRRRWFVVCKCHCGTPCVVECSNLRGGAVQTCGCGKHHPKTHGLAARNKPHPIYVVFRGIVSRCEDINHVSYADYGGRGIFVCDEWRQSPEVFVQWANESGWYRGCHVDRIDNDGPYSPNNCRIATPKENAQNRRRRRA